MGGGMGGGGHRVHTTSGPATDEKGTFVAKGVGGRLELTGNRLRIVKGGLFGYIVSLLGVEGGFVERTIRVSHISSIELDVPVMVFRYIRLSYPGSPSMSGHTLADMMAENAVLMSLVDNRPFYDLVERIERMMDAEGAPTLERLKTNEPDAPGKAPPATRPSALRTPLLRAAVRRWLGRRRPAPPPEGPPEGPQP